MFDYSTRVIAAGLLLAFCVTLETTTHGQLIRGRVGRGQRVGDVVLPTPPYNPNAGVLGSPRARRRPAAKPAERRTVGRKAGAGKRKPRPATPRRRRARRGL